MSFPQFATSWDELTGKPTVFPSDWNIVSNKPANLAQLASFEFWDEISFTTLNTTFQNVWSVMITNPVIQTQIVGTTLQFRVHSGTTQAINWKAKIHLYKTTLP